MKKFLSLVLALMMMLSAVPMAFAEEYREPITLSVFSQVANFAGEQTGWFAKEVKDRFNITLKFVSSNVDPNASPPVWRLRSWATSSAGATWASTSTLL